MTPSSRHSAFTLIELLVVISIIALLIGILLPALGAARSEARAIKCAAQERQVGIGLAAYLAENADAYPASYFYGSSKRGLDWNLANQRLGGSKQNGYVHWSYLLSDTGSVADDAFQCPAIEKGGHPATNPPDDQMRQDQVRDSSTAGDVTDRQVPNVAFTANAALVPRNKFIPSAGEANNVFVKSHHVPSVSDVILAAEFNDNWKAAAQETGGQFLSKSHRPVMPFFNTAGVGNSIYNRASIFAYVKKSNLMTAEQLEDQTDLFNQGDTELNVIGRHHPGGDSRYGGTANFMYADAHVERKSIVDTVTDREWGDEFYSLTGNNTTVHD